MADKATIIYKPGEVYFEPDTAYRYCKLGFENRRAVSLLLEPTPATHYTEYQLFGGVLESGAAWKSLPSPQLDGLFVVPAHLAAPACLVAETPSPWPLADGNALVIAALNTAGKYAEETLTLHRADFEDIAAATAAELAAVVNRDCVNVTAEAVEEYLILRSVAKPEGFISVSSADSVDEVLGLAGENHTNAYSMLREERGESNARGICADMKKVYVRFRKPTGSSPITYDVSDVVSDWVVYDTSTPIIPKTIRNMFGFGVPLLRLDGVPVTDEDIYSFCLAAVSKMEEFLHVYMTPTRIMCAVERRTSEHLRRRFDYDLADDPYDFDARDARQWWYIPMRHYPLIGVPSMRLVYIDGAPVMQFPEHWLKVYHRQGQIQVTPGGRGLDQFAIGIGGQYLPITGIGMYRNVPQYVWIDYTAGFERGQMPAEVWNAACKMACISLFQIGSDAYEFGTTSRSLSDGVISQSWSGMASGQNPLLGARIEQYKKELVKFELDFRGRYRRPHLTVI